MYQTIAIFFLHWGNSLLLGLPASALIPIPLILNPAARVPVETQCWSSPSGQNILMSPISLRAEAWVLTMTHEAVDDLDLANFPDIIFLSLTQLSHPISWVFLKPTRHESTAQPLPILFPMLGRTFSHIPHGSLSHFLEVYAQESPSQGGTPWWHHLKLHRSTPFSTPCFIFLYSAHHHLTSHTHLHRTRDHKNRDFVLFPVAPPIIIAHIAHTLVYVIIFLEALLYHSFNPDKIPIKWV